MSDTGIILRKVLEQTFEDFAFMFIDSVPSSQIQKASSDTYVQAQIDFAAPHEKGRLIAVASLDFCCSLSRNVLGLEPDEALDPGIAESGLSELVNVACGSLAEALYGLDQAVDLQPPEIVVGTDATWEEIMAAEDCLALLVDDDPVGFQLNIAQK